MHMRLLIPLILPRVSACNSSPEETGVVVPPPPSPSVLGTPVHAVLVPVLPDETNPTVEDCRWIRLRGTTLGALGDMDNNGRLRLHTGIEPGPVCDGLVTAAGQACNGPAARCVGAGLDWLQVEHGSSETWTDMGGPYEWRRAKYEVKLVANDGREPLLLVHLTASP